jgi:hypothetical protein
MTAATSAPYVHVQTQGTASAADVDYARDNVLAALRRSRPGAVRPRQAHRVTGSRGGPARPRSGECHLNGRVVRAQVARATLREAVDEIHVRLRDRLQRSAGDWQEIRGGRAQAGEWRHTSVPVERPRYFPLPADERQIVQHKTFGLRRMTIDEAAFDMDLLGYQFHLFAEDGTGSVLYRVDDEPGYRLSQLDPEPDRVTPGAEFVTVSTARPTMLRVEEAIDRLNVTGVAVRLLPRRRDRARLRGLPPIRRPQRPDQPGSLNVRTRSDRGAASEE